MQINNKSPLKFVDPDGYDGAPPVTNVPVGQGLSGGISSATGWQYGNSGSPCTCSTMPNTTVLNMDGNSSSSGIMDAHYRLMLMGTAMSALSTHLNSYIHHTNGYGSTYGMGLASFGFNQSNVSGGGISSSSSPWDYALAQGPPGAVNDFSDIPPKDFSGF